MSERKNPATTKSLKNQIWQALDEVKDPEIPVVSLVEMGIIRAVEIEGHAVTVTMTPTFAGCPALQVMQTGIKTRLEQLGWASVTVKQTLSPPWSSDWITPAARQKLKAFGLAPRPNTAAILNSPCSKPWPARIVTPPTPS
ncbi:MAG: 1,2-phenylacetyl-CoA epoxidase subunit PaaD [Anaerolineae bacterium]